MKINLRAFRTSLFAVIVTLGINLNTNAILPPLHLAPPVLPPLLSAVCDNNLAAVHAILQASANPSAAVSEELNDNLETALSIAAVHGNVVMVNYLMLYQPSLNCIVDAIKRTIYYAVDILQSHNDAHLHIIAVSSLLTRSHFNPAHIHHAAQIELVFSHNALAVNLLQNIYNFIQQTLAQIQQANQAKHNHHSDQGPSAGAIA